MYKKTKIRSILELLSKDLSTRDIAKNLEVSRNTVSQIKDILDKEKRTMDELLSLGDSELYEILYPQKFKPKRHYAQVDYGYVHQELKKIGVTLTLLWEEYKFNCEKEGVKSCGYVTFTNGYKRYIADANYTSHINHKPGVIVEVDWSGPTTSYFNRDKQEQVTAYLFVATLPYSQYTYVEAVESMDETSWLMCHVNMLEFFGGSPVKIVCDNLKTGVVSHPRIGEVVLNDAYLSFGEHYQIAIMPAAVKKPKQKASVEGSVGRIAQRILGMLRNEQFFSLQGLNNAIRESLEILNSKEFQKKTGSRKNIFELEERQKLKPLPLIPFEICQWSYGHKVYPDSHIWFEKNKYSVPSNIIGEKVDVKYNNYRVYIYVSRNIVAEHERVAKGIKNSIRTNPSHLPYPQFSYDTVESIHKEALRIGYYTNEVCNRLFEYEKVKEQAILSIKPILKIATNYGELVLEESCEQALKDFHVVTYNTLMSYVKTTTKNKKKDLKEIKKQTGIVRGADYYARKENK